MSLCACVRVCLCVYGRAGVRSCLFILHVCTLVLVSFLGHWQVCHTDLWNSHSRKDFSETHSRVFS